MAGFPRFRSSRVGIRLTVLGVWKGTLILLTFENVDQGARLCRQFVGVCTLQSMRSQMLQIEYRYL